MAADPLIQVTGLRKTFGNHRVLDGLDLDVRVGEAVAVLGANGAGKTTLLKVLATLVRPTRGTAIVAGHDCARDPERVRREIGLVAHGSYVYEDLTASENLTFWTTLAGERPSAAALAGALATVELDRAADERVRTFSAGMKRRCPSRGSSWYGRGCCCSTSRSPDSISGRRSGSRSTSRRSRPAAARS